MESFSIQQNYRIRHAQGVEKMRAEGGVSFIYDEPHKFERYHDQRERVILNAVLILKIILISENQRD